MIEQLGDTLKVLLDPERLDRQDKDRFLGVFYDFYIHWLITPFVEPQEPDRFDATPEFSSSSSLSKTNSSSSSSGGGSSSSSGSSGGVSSSSSGGSVTVTRSPPPSRSRPLQSLSAIATSRRILLEIFSLCVHGHTYRMKYFIMRNNVIARSLRVLRSPHR